MGMDVFGRKPKSKSGEYFRANVWGWRPIHRLICELCGDLIDDENLAGMSLNQGNGVKSAKVCRQMADRFDKWMETNVDGYEIADSVLVVTDDGKLVTVDEAKRDNLKVSSPYFVDDELLKEWVNFLRDCGGFEVW